MHAPLRVLVEFTGPAFQISHQLRAVPRARFSRTQRIQLQRDAVQPEVLPQACTHQDVFSVDVRPGKTQGLDTDLMKLAVTPLLRPLMAEHRSAVPQPLRTRIQQVVLDHRAHARRRAFGTQRQLFAVQLVGEGVYLLLDNVGNLAD